MTRILSLLIAIIVLFLQVPPEAFAADEKNYSGVTVGEIGGYLAAGIQTVKNLYLQRKFSYPQGHGFAAERANNFIDYLNGYNSHVVGDNNVANGPDRIIFNRDGTKVFIQDKYCKTASESVEAAFDSETGLYRYMDSNGPMKLEVPKDQYHEAIKSMEQKIREGKIKGVTDPSEASNIVKEGHYTYDQALNLTKAGNIDSLKYDAANGAIIATCAMGISFALDYVSCRMNGLPPEESLKNASLNGLKTGGVAFATYVISSQLAKTGLKDAIAPTANAVANSLGEGLSKSLLNLYGIEIAGKEIAKKVSEVLANQLITSGVIVAVLTVPDVIDLFRGRISKEQLLKNLIVTVVSVAGATAGGIIGTAVGTAVVPGAGSAVGATVGGVVGGVIGGTAAGLAGDMLLSSVYEGDAQQMYEIITEVFTDMSNDYLLAQGEADIIVNQVRDELAGSKLKDMYASEDRKSFAKELMRPYFDDVVKMREGIKIPTSEEARASYIASLQGIVFIH